MLALVIDGAVTATTDTPPVLARRLDSGAWETPGADGWTDEALASCGWLPVAVPTRPDDTDTHTTEVGWVITGDTVMQTWTPRPWTAEEIAGQAAQQVADTLAADTKTDLDKIAEAIAKLATLLGDETTVGSVRAVIGPVGAPAGTANLRAIRAKTATDGTVVKLAASVAALAARCIDLAQLVIDTDQAARRTARQVQRLARMMVGDYTSAGVGSDLQPSHATAQLPSKETP